MKNKLALLIGATISLLGSISYGETGDIRGLTSVIGGTSSVPAIIPLPSSSAGQVLKSTGTPGTSAIAPGFIFNENIAANAAIPMSKLAFDPANRANHYGNDPWSALNPSTIPANLVALANSSAVAGVWTSDGVGGFNWIPVGASSFPNQAGQSGKFLTTNGSAVSWGTPTGVISNLTLTASSTNNVVSNTNGTGFTIPLADGTNAGLLNPAFFTKLNGIAAGATANSTDAALRDRTTHTGITPVSGGGTGTATPALVAGTNITISGTWPNQTINSTATGTLGSVVTETTTSRTLILSDANAYIRCTNASATTIVVPTNASVAFPIGTEIYIRRTSSGGTITLSGATVEGGSTSTTVTTNGTFCIKKVATDTWDFN